MLIVNGSCFGSFLVAGSRDPHFHLPPAPPEDLCRSRRLRESQERLHPSRRLSAPSEVRGRTDLRVVVSSELAIWGGEIAVLDPKTSEFADWLRLNDGLRSTVSGGSSIRREVLPTAVRHNQLCLSPQSFQHVRWIFSAEPLAGLVLLAHFSLRADKTTIFRQNRDKTVGPSKPSL